ncbi:site-specific integrase [Nocardioides sp. KR10-350]|uniref:site-specific integrase n=1 Tax=Nocardioides cheoyonin TaxID=3156615 RepID=UPI0032B5E8F3
MSAATSTATTTSGTRACASCGTPRRSRRVGWTFRVRDGVAVSVTCPACPTYAEPIRRLAPNLAGQVRFRAVVGVTPPGGTRRQHTRTFPTLPEAREWVALVRSQGSAPSRETVADLVGRWVASRTDVRAVTRDGYAAWAAPALRVIGHRVAAEVTVRDIEHLTVTLTERGGRGGRPLAPGSVRAVLIPLAGAFDLAVRDGMMPANPVRIARKPRTRARVGTDLEHWTPAQLLTFRETSDRNEWAPLWRLTLAGLTRADVMGLRWCDVDLEAGTVTVAQGRVVHGSGTATDEPKSAQRRRTVPVEVIHPGTAGMLRSLHARQAEARLAAGSRWRDTGLVAADALGRPTSPRDYSARFAVLCAEAGVPPIRLHSVRHSLAFWLHSLGVTPADAAALLGHTVDVHLRTYLPASGASGIAAAAAALGHAAEG